MNVDVDDVEEESFEAFTTDEIDVQDYDVPIDDDVEEVPRVDEAEVQMRVRVLGFHGLSPQQGRLGDLFHALLSPQEHAVEDLSEVLEFTVSSEEASRWAASSDELSRVNVGRRWVSMFANDPSDDKADFFRVFDEECAGDLNFKAETPEARVEALSLIHI